MMKAILVEKYGGPDVLQFKECPDPSPGPGEVLVRVAAVSINPIDVKRRSGDAKAFMPIKFPGILGVDVSGTVAALGAGVKGFSVGDRVFGMADHTYAELCVAKAEALAKIPDGLDLVDAAAIPLVTTTGSQLITKGTGASAGQIVLVAGALGSVGRSAVFTAKARGAKVIAGVRKAQLEKAGGIGAESAVAIDDESAVAKLPALDAVADAVNGKTAALLISKVKTGGRFGSVLGPPQNAADFPSVKVVPVYAQADPKGLLEMAQAVMDGKLEIPIVAKFPLKDASKGHALVEKGGAGKVVLVAEG